MSDAHILHRASTINHNVAVALQSSAIVIIYINVGFFDATRMYCDKTIEAIESRSFHCKVALCLSFSMVRTFDEKIRKETS